MVDLNLALAVLGAVIVAIGLLSVPIKRSVLQEPVVAVLVGIVVGPYVLDWIDLARWGDENTVLEQSARLTLAIALMGVALRISRPSFAALWRPVAVLLTVVMLGMWLVSSALAAGLLGLSLWVALLLGAVITPTDPVVASTIVSGRFAHEHLPLRVRDAISLEAGANDGLAYLLVFLPVLVLLGGPDTAWTSWLVEGLVIGVLLAAVIGVAVGLTAAKLLNVAERSQTIEPPSLLGYSVAFTLFTLGVSSLLGADALISVFLAGLIFNVSVGQREEHEEKQIQEAAAKLFTLPMFILFGAALPFAEWLNLGWPLLALVVGVLLLRRPPIVGALFPALRRALNPRDTAYVAWFGPIGIAAIYYATFAHARLDEPLIWHVASAVVFASIVIHGATAAPLTRWYARRPTPSPPATRELDAVTEAP